MRRCLLLLFLYCLASPRLCASGPAFDLAGPKVDVHVKRGGVTLPISEVPNLLPGDRLWIHPDFPDSQSTRFVLVVAFLRGATNPPPPEWFTRAETWNQDVRDEGVFVNVPDGAEQALLFLAPETGGGFNTLRKAVHDQPGTFVRAAQDLQAASLDRMRVEAYLAQVKVTSQTDLKSLKERAVMATRSLGLKLAQQCFDKPIDQQAPCLAQNPEGLVLDDANAQSLVAQLTTGSTVELMNAISSSSMAGGGAYSPYVGAIVDTARILSSLHTAHFRYIPALALPTADTLNLRLNMPPSFRNPKSVVVVALPPLGPAKPEPLHPVFPGEHFCAEKPNLVLPAEGAPLVFATQLAHDLVLHIAAPAGSTQPSIDLPLTADPATGGLVLQQPAPPLPAGELNGVVRGKWGFDDWTGPQYHLLWSQPGGWTLAAADQSALVVGRDDTLHFRGQNTLCIDRIEAQAGDGKPVKLTWKSPHPELLDVTVPMKEAAPGPVTVSIYQYGVEKPESLAMTAFADAASLDRLTLNAGDPVALLKGTRLDEVARAEFDGVTFTPTTLSRVEDRDQLLLTATASTARLDPGKHYVARVALKDGRLLRAPVRVDPPRPQATLLNKGVQSDASAPPSPVQLGSPDDLPLDGRLVFFLKSTVPAKFPRSEKVDLAATDGGFSTELSLADGSMMLEDATTAMGSLEPLSRFGSSAFGPIHIRVVSADGTAGDWMPLGTLVRLPGFKELRCPRAATKPCILTGSNLFLADSVSATPDFDNSADVPPDFTGTQFAVPHPANGVLYLKLRDDPATVQTLTLPVTLVSPAESKAAVAQAQSAAATPSATPPPAATQPATTAPETVQPATPPATAVPTSPEPAGLPAASDSKTAAPPAGPPAKL
ncbi:MAG TPA: hypothetical protein VMW15_07815 [Terracidiphilus sp.]|nr:hypothetical protein [Terracidiphilus sp.]